MFKFKGKETDWMGFEFRDNDGVIWTVSDSGKRSPSAFSLQVEDGWWAFPSILPNLVKFRHFFLLSDLQSYYIEQLSQKICTLEKTLSKLSPPTSKN